MWNKIKNFLKLRGTYNWAISQMKEGFIVRSQSLSHNRSLYYDYEYNLLMINVETQYEINSYAFSNEFLYMLKKIDNFYVSTGKKFAFTSRKHTKNINVPFKESFTVTKELFKTK